MMPTSPTGGSPHAYNSMTAGRRVYGGSSGPSHPTSGTLNPQGYVGREMNRRSGLASAILGKRGAEASTPGLHPSQVGVLVSRHPHAVLARMALLRRMGKS